MVVVGQPSSEVPTGRIEAEEQSLIEELVPRPGVEGLADAVLLRLTRGDEVPGDPG